MMKKLIGIFILLAIILASALLTPWLMRDPGYVYFRFAGYEMEMRFIVALGLAVLLGVLIWLAFFLLRLPKKTVKNFAANRSRKSFAMGLLALSEGKWQQAEKLLITSSKNSPTPELSFMAAARAAIAQNKIDLAFAYLDEAEIHTDNPLTVDLTRCELWLKTGDNKQAITLLQRILATYPNNPRALRLMLQASQEAQQWQQLREILPKVKKLEILTVDKVEQFSDHAIKQQLQYAETEKDLQASWNSLDKNQKLNPDYIKNYAQTGLKLGLHEHMAKLLEATINKEFSTELLHIWQQLNLNAHDKIKSAEKWLKKNPDNAVLLQTLGQLCLQSQLWGKAHEYLKKSLNLQPQEKTYQLLANYFDAVGEADNALKAYQQAQMQHSQLVVTHKNLPQHS